METMRIINNMSIKSHGNKKKCVIRTVNKTALKCKGKDKNGKGN